MRPEVFTALVTVLLGAPLVALITAVFNRRKAGAEAFKADAEADAVRMSAVFGQVEPLHRIIATLDARVTGQEQQMQRMSERIVAQQVKLDAAEEQIGILTRREREFLEYRAQVAAYEQHVSARLREAGLDVPEPPMPPPPREERTRRTDKEHTT